MEAPQRIKKTTTNDPAISLLATYAREMKTGYQKDTCIPMITAALLTITKTEKPPKSINE